MRRGLLIGTTKTRTFGAKLQGNPSFCVPRLEHLHLYIFVVVVYVRENNGTEQKEVEFFLKWDYTCLAMAKRTPLLIEEHDALIHRVTSLIRETMEREMVLPSVSAILTGKHVSSISQLTGPREPYNVSSMTFRTVSDFLVAHGYRLEVRAVPLETPASDTLSA